MTTLVEGLKAYIEAQVTTAGKGFPIEVPQDETYPAWSYQVIDDDQLLAHSGGTGYSKARVQIDLMAPEAGGISAYLNAKGIARTMRTKLDGFKGDMNGVQVEFCKTTQSDDYADIHRLPVASFDVIIHYIIE